MKFVRVLFGAALGFLLLGVLWFAAVVQPPEALSRRAAVFVAGLPGEGEEVAVERISCPVLPKLRLYVVCTDDCEGIWRIVGVRGLQPSILADLGRIPRERPGVARRRINLAVARESLRLDADSAREMIGCYLRIDGLDPGLVLPAGGRAAVEAARASDGEMSRFLRDLERPGVLSRLEVVETAEGYETRFDYWDVHYVGWPVVQITMRIAHDGQARSVHRSDPVGGEGGAERQ